MTTEYEGGRETHKKEDFEPMRGHVWTPRGMEPGGGWLDTIWVRESEAREAIHAAEMKNAKLASPQYVRDESEAWRVLRLISELETTENGIYTNAGKVMKQMALNALAAHGDIPRSI